MELSDSMIMQMLGEANAAERRAGEDALAIECSPQQVHDIELAARCETIRSYLYQAGILGDTRLRCSKCGKSVSTPVPADTVVRAWIECPECIETDSRFRTDAFPQGRTT